MNPINKLYGGLQDVVSRGSEGLNDLNNGIDKQLDILTNEPTTKALLKSTTAGVLAVLIARNRNILSSDKYLRRKDYDKITDSYHNLVLRVQNLLDTHYNKRS